MLTDAQIKAMTPQEQERRIAYGRGLCLVVKGTSKWWHFRYKFDGKEKKISLGCYPDVPLDGCWDAESKCWIQGVHERCEAMRKLLAQGVNPSEVRKARKAEAAELETASVYAGTSFEEVAMEWYERSLQKWTEGHTRTILSRLKRDCFVTIGSEPISQITAPMLLRLLRAIEERGANETAYRVQNIFSQIWDFAIACGYVTSNPARPLRKALSSVKTRHLPALTDPAEVGGYMRAIDAYKGGEVVRAALQVGVLTFVRPGELRGARWEEIDFKNAQWNIPAERMKIKVPHAVPLSRQAMDVLRRLHVYTGKSEYVFPSPRNPKRKLSENGVLVAMRTMGYGKEVMCGHGVRAMARTILDERLQVPAALIEQQLAHVVRDPLGRAYNRTTHLPARVEMMQRWANALDLLRQGKGLEGA